MVYPIFLHPSTHGRAMLLAGCCVGVALFLVVVIAVAEIYYLAGHHHHSLWLLL
jgi:hypothetical protein